MWKPLPWLHVTNFKASALLRLGNERKPMHQVSLPSVPTLGSSCLLHFLLSLLLPFSLRSILLFFPCHPTMCSMNDLQHWSLSWKKKTSETKGNPWHAILRNPKLHPSSIPTPSVWYYYFYMIVIRQCAEWWASTLIARKTCHSFIGLLLPLKECFIYDTPFIYLLSWLPPPSIPLIMHACVCALYVTATWCGPHSFPHSLYFKHPTKSFNTSLST